MTKTNKTADELYKTADKAYEGFCDLSIKGVYSTFYTLNQGCKFVWANRNNRIVLGLSIFAISASIGIHLNTENELQQLIALSPCLLLLFICGLIARIKEYIIKKRSLIFLKINFKDRCGNIPEISKIEKAGKGREILTIKSYILFQEWIDSKDRLEQLFNATISIKKTSKRTEIKIIKFGGVKI
jgi:hypothetical protein